MSELPSLGSISSGARAVGSPLPRGPASHPPLAADPDDADRQLSMPSAQRQLTPSSPSENINQPATRLQRTVGALRAALPFVQRLLPLLDGNFATSAANLLSPYPVPPPPQINLAPIESTLAELQADQRELRSQVLEQNTSLNRVEDQLDMVREATDRNTLEQQELIEDLKSVGHKVNLLAFLAFALLAISIVLNVVLYLQLRRVLP
jgi:hypothetical protein